jgi:lipoprotein NlpI
VFDFSRVLQFDDKSTRMLRARGLAHAELGDLANAFGDLDRAIDLEPASPWSYSDRARLHLLQGERAKAMADFDQAVAVAPDEGMPYLERGNALFNLGEFAAAAEDHAKALQRHALDAKNDGYILLFRHLDAAHLGRTGTDALADGAGALLAKNWPYAVIELYLGQRTPAATLKAASKPDEACEAHYYVGQWRLLNGDKDAALKELNTAAASCPHEFIEYRAALAELTRIGR